MRCSYFLHNLWARFYSTASDRFCHSHHTAIITSNKPSCIARSINSNCLVWVSYYLILAARKFNKVVYFLLRTKAFDWRFWRLNSVAFTSHFFPVATACSSPTSVKPCSQQTNCTELNSCSEHVYTVCPKNSEPLNILQQQPQICSDLNKNFTHTRRHLPYFVYEMFNSDWTFWLFWLTSTAMETHDLWVMLFKNSYFSKDKADLYETM